MSKPVSMATLLKEKLLISIPWLSTIWNAMVMVTLSYLTNYDILNNQFASKWKIWTSLMATGKLIFFKSPSNDDNVVTTYFSYFISHYQFGKTNQYEKAKIELMGYLCADLAFDFLRTKSTLGYLCFSKVIKVSDYYGFRQGSKENSPIQ